MNIGYAIKTTRKELNLSQEELAKKAKITQSHLSQIELGKKRPHARTFTNIAKALQTPESVLQILSMEQDDVPAKKRKAYDTIFPKVRDLVLCIVRA